MKIPQKIDHQMKWLAFPSCILGLICLIISSIILYHTGFYSVLLIIAGISLFTFGLGIIVCMSAWQYYEGVE